MTKRMLIDATQPEETRVVVLGGNRVEDFDFETATKKQLKGNIYLARVTRVEPSLQAAFVEYGGNRHGFLAFNEIHPDYYRIPMEDREALLRQQSAARDDEDDDIEIIEPEDAVDDSDTEDDQPDTPEVDSEADSDDEAGSGDTGSEDGTDETAEVAAAHPETVGGDAMEEVEERRPRRQSRHYKIQEVVTRRQIMLVQVVKEERGNKGAALTTYLSLAGRYCVLMPNTARGGGVSRKITNLGDRKRLKTIVEDLDVPEGMAVIVRTAGSERTKPEVKRDYEYLLRLWDDIREQTLESSAPALIHEEGNLIKRTIRDLYASDINEVLVDGEDGYKVAKQFMRTLVPSHAKRVQLYKNGGVPLFQRHQVENQLDAVHNPVVQLRSGGYIVINQTEALVAIDVNSGRATRERNIEETARKTNLEAAEEVARQLRLRDMAGLIVIDFIDMDENRNQHAVERRLKDAMRNDRARIQIGRISHFGLLELSRQRLRPSLFEASSQPCPVCNGTGHVRSTESSALHVLRAVEEEGIRQRTSEINVHLPTAIGFYILNFKRDILAGIEERYAFKVNLQPDDSLIQPDHRIERLQTKSPSERIKTDLVEVPEAVNDEEESPSNGQSGDQNGGGQDEDTRRGRGRGRRRRGGKRRDEEQPTNEETTEESVSEDAAEGDRGEGSDVTRDEDEEGTARKRRRRGKRGGRRRSRRREEGSVEESTTEGTEGTEGGTASNSDEPQTSVTEVAAAETEVADVVAEAVVDAVVEAAVEAVAETGQSNEAPADAEETKAEAAGDTDGSAEPDPEEKPKRARRTRAPRKKAAPKVEVAEDSSSEETPSEEAPSEAAAEAEAKPEEAAEEKPKPRARRTRAPRKKAEPKTETEATPETGSEPAPEPVAAAEEPAPAPVVEEAVAAEAQTDEAPAKPTRRGWWNRLSS
ncbi:MAG: ribonuclease E/G [Rhodospirillaceae bacterium]|jgi:ribonuclease E|nr:ribonuclease E/G [Rhodospirillaceae bacterium]MBT6139159.1 ribonuclease E/G [Rhodospirillaceae bacterium]